MSKKRKLFVPQLGTVAIENGLADAALHFLGFAAQHRCLIGDTDRFQMQIGIEAGRMRVAEFFQKRLLVAAVADVIANVIRFGERKDDEVMSLAVTERA